ncbi:MAG TPA: HAD-IA family hydrolase [Thermoanaerobaculia bacterium]|jgi:phosphoglycolate phosphatase|nr:HAD-IA family hydrolase [Thermoanaerobaculia bacterium]
MRDSTIELLIFDWDGTLMDSVGPIVACTQAVIGELGLGSPAEATIRGTVGLGLRETIDLLVPGCDDQLYERVRACYRRHWVETYRDLPLLFPGVTAMLGELARAGYLLAVATGKSRRGLDFALDQTGLRGHFQATRTADEAISKPHPRMLLDILDQLGVRPHAALMVGDSIYDLQMAANAGSEAVAILSGAHGREELAAHDPRAVLDRVAELPGWLAGERLRAAGHPLAPAAI